MMLTSFYLGIEVTYHIKLESNELAEKIDRVETTLHNQTYEEASIENEDHVVPSPEVDKS